MDIRDFLLPLVIGALVGLALTFIAYRWKKKPPVEKEEGTVYPSFFLFKWIFIVGALFFGLVAILAANDGAYGPSIIFGLFFIASITCHILFGATTFRVDNNVIHYRNWKGQETVLPATDISKISYSPLKEAIVLEAMDGRIAAFYTGYRGTSHFIRWLQSNLSPALQPELEVLITKRKFNLDD